MFFQLLFSSTLVAVIWVTVILISLTVHEFAHAYIGFRFGDRTAEAMGRLTLNPIAHIDPAGFLLLLLFGFGWAKPVPFNPYNLKDPKKDAVFIAFAGPISNILLAIFAAIIFRLLFVFQFATESLLPVFLVLLIIINLILAFFNLLPIPPLDGSKLIDALLTSPKQAQIRTAIMMYGPRVLFVLVLISLFTPINIFGFISLPAFFLCDISVGDSCATIMYSVL